MKRLAIGYSDATGNYCSAPGPWLCDCGHVEGIHWENNELDFHGCQLCSCKIAFKADLNVSVKA